MGGLAQLVGSLLSWLHQGLPNICPGGWPWTVTAAGVLLASSPVVGATLVALTRKVTGNRYPTPTVVTFGVIGLLFGFLVPCVVATWISNDLTAAAHGVLAGLTRHDAATLAGPACFFDRFGTQAAYLGSGPSVYEVLVHPVGGTAMFGVRLTLLVAVPLVTLLAIRIQQGRALRRGPRWPGRLMWLPFLGFALGTAPLQANTMAQLWLGLLPASLVGALVVGVLGPPAWSVINRPARPEPGPAPRASQPPPPPPRTLSPTLLATSSPGPARLADTPGPLPLLGGTPAVPTWNWAGGRFRRVRQLGQGGFGTVWLAVDTQLDRTVALKLAHAPDDETQQRMLREARALAAVHHPHCVRVYDIVEDADGLGIVMEYIDGRPLSDVVAQGGPLDDQAAARLWSTLADALTRAHAQGVLHRDVKPANVLVDGDGMPHLIDFGIARTRGDVTLTAAGMMVGTPDFLAPETAATGLASPASDAWQLAATVSYALTGQPPRGHRANPMSALMAAAQRLPITHLPERSHHRPLLRAALDADPARRPTLVTVRDELIAWLAHRGYPERGPVTAIVSGSPPATRRMQ